MTNPIESSSEALPSADLSDIPDPFLREEIRAVLDAVSRMPSNHVAVRLAGSLRVLARHMSADSLLMGQFMNQARAIKDLVQIWAAEERRASLDAAKTQRWIRIEETAKMVFADQPSFGGPGWAFRQAVQLVDELDRRRAEFLEEDWILVRRPRPEDEPSSKDDR